MQVLTPIERLFENFDAIPYDRTSIPQERLNLANKFRTSIFPWRGQFSPELIELFLTHYSRADSVILDPFVGSGTTVFEAARKGLTCYGTEINPSAIEMAKTIHFAKLTTAERKEIFHTAVSLAEQYIKPFIWDLFSYQHQEKSFFEEADESLEKLFGSLIQETQSNLFVSNLLVNAVIRYMTYPTSRTKTDFLRALQEHIKIVQSIPFSNHECKVLHADARTIPLSNESIDIVITSPPYINVFNYHQNNRSAMELMGWDILDIAKSEIGANRKHRQNRFLTVIQYALDMFDVLKELRRLLRPQGRAIIVVGRESTIRGLNFRNGALVAALAHGSSIFELERRQERVFKNKFGEIIYEDILHFIPSTKEVSTSDSFARLVALCSLQQALQQADEEVRTELLEAQARAYMVEKSPLFKANFTPRSSLGLLKEHQEAYESEGSIMQKKYPTPHFDKLKATLENEKLPLEDKPQVEKALAHYTQWIASMDEVMSNTETTNQKLQKMVDLLNEYRVRMDIDLIFDSHHDWLYRQKGQIKLDNSVIEEFLPRLVYSPLVPELVNMDIVVGPIKAFSSLWFDSSLTKIGTAGGLNIRTKDQDFAIGKPLYLKASHSQAFDTSVQEVTYLAYIAAECKTNLDKTMFQEGCATARDLKTAIPSAKYFLICEWLDMKPISSRTTPIDEVLVLREAKRIGSGIRKDFSTFEGRQKARTAHIQLLQENPCRAKVFSRLLDYIRQLLDNEPLDKETVLERGYF